ncbi:MAG: ABC transporter permease [Planctomycetota bacterium]|jgi:ABC-type dipeptide/oligopeptide/nickel transport system permease subunit|nr:ABC transporter permease [Planctomycetota bacterium]
MSHSYWQIVWTQFKKNRLAVAGLGAAALFFAVALAAPFIAGRLPFYWLAADGALTFPFWREFFAPVDTREYLLDVAFNYLFLFAVWAGVCAVLFRRRRRPLLVGGTLLLLPFIFTSSRNQPQNYYLAAEQHAGRGLFPLAPYGPYEQGMFRPKTPPSWSHAVTSRATATGAATGERYSYLGSDEVGRDVLARLAYGSRVSLTVGFISVAIATAIGLLVGAIAGYCGGWVDILISRAIEILMCFPTFFLILTVIAFLDQRSILNIMLIIGLTGWTGTAMVIRGEIFKQRSLDYVAAARALGASRARVVFRHILPNALAPVLVGISFSIAGAIAMESGLSFLGIGVASPTATWGELLMEGRDSPLPNWWLSIFPGLAIFAAMTAYNLIGEGLRDAMDPRLRK